MELKPLRVAPVGFVIPKDLSLGLGMMERAGIDPRVGCGGHLLVEEFEISCNSLS